MGVVATSDFTGTNGATPTGWTVGGAGSHAIQSNKLQLTTVATSFNGGANAYWSTPAALNDMEVTITINFQNPKVEQYAVVAVRADTVAPSAGTYPDNGYFVELDTNGNQIIVRRAVATSFTVLNTIPKTFTVATDVITKVRAEGARYSVKVWNVGSGEPDWDVSAVDSSPFLTAGRVFLSAQNGAATAARTFNFDDASLDDCSRFPRSNRALQAVGRASSW